MKRFLTIFFLIALFGVLSPLTAYSDQYCRTSGWEGKNPVFDNVERVIIVVDIRQSLQHDLEARIPSALQRENLEKIMKELYTKRYATDGRLDTDSRGCYNRNNQKVRVMSESEIKDKKHIELSKDPETLTAYLTVLYIDKDAGRLNYGKDMVAFSLVNYRSNVEIPIFKQLYSPFALSFENPNEILDKNFRGFIGNSIR